MDSPRGSLKSLEFGSRFYESNSLSSGQKRVVGVLSWDYLKEMFFPMSIQWLKNRIQPYKVVQFWFSLTCHLGDLNRQSGLRPYLDLLICIHQLRSIWWSFNHTLAIQLPGWTFFGKATTDFQRHALHWGFEGVMLPKGLQHLHVPRPSDDFVVGLPITKHIEVGGCEPFIAA